MISKLHETWKKEFFNVLCLIDFRPKQGIDCIEYHVNDELNICPARAYKLYVYMVNIGGRHSVGSFL